MRIAKLAGISDSPALRSLAAALDAQAPTELRELAAVLAQHGLERPGRAGEPGSPRSVGLSGAQGVGKSTLAALLEQAWARLGRRACVLSLDDFYLGRAERRRLAESVHPLFETRGPPGTYDLGRLREVLHALRGDEEVAVPCFDKGLDDRTGWRRLCGPFDPIVLEGWCIGATPLDRDALGVPCNRLEAEEDPDGTWRRAIARALEEDYQPLWRELDVCIVLQAPDLECVRRWRLAQETERPVDRRMDRHAVDRFVDHFERITRSMADQPRQPGEIRVAFGRDHRIVAIEGLAR